MPSDEQAIRDLVAEWHRATAEGDVSRVLRLMSEDAVFLTPGQPPMRGRETFAKGMEAMLAHMRFESTFTIEEVSVAGSIAYTVTHLRITLTPLFGGSSMRRSGYTLSIMRKQPDGTWVLLRDANLLTPEPAPSA